MGWVRKHTGTDGKARYTATYRDARGRKRSAGTFSTKRDASNSQDLWIGVSRDLLIAI